MTGRRRWSRISIRFGLICISAIAISLALHSHFQAAGERRKKATLALSEIGIASFHAGDAVDYDEFKFIGTTSTGSGFPLSTPGVRLVLPKVIQAKPSQLSILGRRLFGSEMFDDYGTLLVCKPISDNNDELFKRLSELPNINSIHYYQNTIDDALIKKIKSKRPEVTLKPLDADAPKDQAGQPVLVKL